MLLHGVGSPGVWLRASGHDDGLAGMVCQGELGSWCWVEWVVVVLALPSYVIDRKASLHPAICVQVHVMDSSCRKVAEVHVTNSSCREVAEVPVVSHLGLDVHLSDVELAQLGL